MQVFLCKVQAFLHSMQYPSNEHFRQLEIFLQFKSYAPSEARSRTIHSRNIKCSFIIMYMRVGKMLNIFHNLKNYSITLSHDDPKCLIFGNMSRIVVRNYQFTLRDFSWNKIEVDGHYLNVNNETIDKLKRSLFLFSLLKVYSIFNYLQYFTTLPKLINKLSHKQKKQKRCSLKSWGFEWIIISILSSELWE